MDIIESLEWRYATKKFDSSIIIDDKKIERICTAFNLTATSYGLQPIKLLVVKNKDLQQELKAASFNQVQVSSASHVFVICVENNINAEFINKYFENIKNTRAENHDKIDDYHKTLAKRFVGQTDDELKLWATKQAYIALGNLMTVCAAEKVDSCPMEGFMPNKVDEILKLDQKQLSSVLLLPVGERDITDTSSTDLKVRRPITEIIEAIF